MTEKYGCRDHREAEDRQCSSCASPEAGTEFAVARFKVAQHRSCEQFEGACMQHEKRRLRRA